LVKISNVLQDIYHEADGELFLLNLKQDLTVGVLVLYIYSLFVCLACTRRLHVGGHGRITEKQR